VKSTLKKIHFYFDDVGTLRGHLTLGGRQSGKPLGEQTFLTRNGECGGPGQSLDEK
jgi:hypothetical protein